MKYTRKTAGYAGTDYTTNSEIAKELNTAPVFGQKTGIQKKLVATYEMNESQNITEDNRNYIPKDTRNQGKPL